MNLINSKKQGPVSTQNVKNLCQSLQSPSILQNIICKFCFVMLNRLAKSIAIVIDVILKKVGGWKFSKLAV